MHTSPPMWWYRNSQTSKSDSPIHRKRFWIWIYKRNWISAESFRISAHYPLRRLYVKRTRNEISSKMCRRCTHSYDKLWNCDCLYERNLKPEHLYLSRHVRLKGNLDLVTDYIVCSSFTRKAPLGAFLQGIVTVNAIYIS